MTFEELQQANSLIKTTPIKGKNYAQVPERIKAFRSLFPMGTIETELLANNDGVCVFKAVVRVGETILGVGHAYEKEDSSFINQTCSSRTARHRQSDGRSAWPASALTFPLPARKNSPRR